MDRQTGGSTARSPSGNNPPVGVFERLITTLFGTDDPQRLKRRELKHIGKKLKRSKYKFYKPRGQQALPGLARFFFELYRVVAPAQKLLQNAENSAGLRSLVIEEFMTPEQYQLRAMFEEEAIRERAKDRSTKEVAGELKESMVSFFGMFDGRRVKQINATYNRLLSLVSFVKFDYYFLLRKFDSKLPENDFNYKPKFEAISAEYIVDDLKDFLELLLPLEINADWDSVLNVLQQYKGVEVIARSNWRKQLTTLEAVRNSNVLDLIVRHADEKPSYKPEMRAEKHRIVEPYLNTIKTTTEATLQKIANERRQKKVTDLATRIFGPNVVARTKYYTEKANIAYEKRMLAGFTRTQPLNYMKAFLMDYFKKDVREVVRDILVVRGRWTSTVSSQKLSEAFHEVMNISEQVVKFDESLADEGELGMKLRKASGKVVDRDQRSTTALRDMLDEVNGRAGTMIQEGTQNLVTIGKYLKMLMEDYERENPEMILNWRELEGFTEEPLPDRMKEIYTQIYYFAQLMQLFAKR